jgi:hypothetical protein
VTSARLSSLAIAVVILALPAVAAAYPQFQLSKDQTCTSCHLSPAGGGLLSENGLAVAESQSTYGGTPEAAHGKLVGPDWLVVGADFRAAAGGLYDLSLAPAGFPMQAEGAAQAHFGAFSLYATLGIQSGDTNNAITFLQMREHYLMWQQNPGSTTGLYVRVGRFMPVFGLRFAEHNDFTRQYGQTPLYGEAYGAALEYIQSGWEAHLTAFVHDPIQDAVEMGNGVALYTEARLTKEFSIGVEGRYAKSPADARTAGGATAKYWVEPANLLFQLEGIAIHQTFAAGGERNQLVSYLMASWFLHDGWMLDFGLSQFDEDVKVKDVDLEAFDVNLHWFASSNWELLFTNRIQTTALGSGGGNSGYSLFQFHYRL